MKSQENKKPHKIVLYFQVHQPRRLNTVKFFDIPNEPLYFNDALNESIVKRVTRDCYIPASEHLLKVIDQYPEIKIAMSLSGVVIEQLAKYAPDGLDAFKRLARTGAVEFLAETYYHSLASLISGEEFEVQVLQHAELIYEHFGVRPTVFRNTELIYNNDIGKRIAMMGYRGIFTEGHERILNGQSPHQLYSHPDQPDLAIFLRNYRLSDDIAFRFLENGFPLRVDRYMSWLNAIPKDDHIVNLAMDYETFGEHHKRDSGIFQFLDELLIATVTSDKFELVFPSQALELLTDRKPLSIETNLSWADAERDISAWLGNDMQKDAFNSLMKLETDVRNLGNAQLLRYWRYLQTSDHFYYMSVKTDTDGSVHSYFSPFPSSYEAFISYMNVITHLTLRIQQERSKPVSDEHDLSSWEADRQEDKSKTPVWVMNLESVPQGNVPDTHS